MYGSEGWKEALPLFECGDGHGRKHVFLTFDGCTWEERGELRLVGLSLCCFPVTDVLALVMCHCRYGAMSPTS